LPPLAFPDYSYSTIRTTESNLKEEIHVQEYSSARIPLLSSTQATSMQSEDAITVIMKVRHLSCFDTVKSLWSDHPYHEHIDHKSTQEKKITKDKSELGAEGEL